MLFFQCPVSFSKEWTQKSIELCESPWGSRKGCCGGLTPWWGMGTVQWEQERLLKGGRVGLYEDFGCLLTSQENYAWLYINCGV